MDLQQVGLDAEAGTGRDHGIGLQPAGVGIPDHADTGELRHALVQQLEPFAREGRQIEKDAGHVAARPRDALSVFSRHWIGLEIVGDDLHSARRLLGGATRKAAGPAATNTDTFWARTSAMAGASLSATPSVVRKTMSPGGSAYPDARTPAASISTRDGIISLGPT